MRSIGAWNGVENDWIRVSRAAPCPICGGARDCRTHAEEAFACCLRQPSDWRLSNGGWLHRVVRSPVRFALDARNADARNVDARNADARNVDARNADARNVDSLAQSGIVIKPREGYDGAAALAGTGS